MFGRLKKLFGSNSQSKGKAKSRLHFVLVQDRSGLTNAEMAGFKRDLVGVIQRYFEIDERSVGIEYQRDSGSTTMIINSPVLRRRAEGPKKSNEPAKFSSKKNKKDKKKQEELAAQPAQA